MREFFRSRFTGQKLQHLYVHAALGNFVGFVAGSMVTVLTTYRSIEGRSVRNLFGILPRKTVVVHLLPAWLEWTLAILVGYVVMEVVRHLIQQNRYLRLIAGTREEPAAATDRTSRTA